MNEIVTLLLAWYDASKRILPWRDVHNPYGTWVSEVMLQQTRVETVIPYYHRFMAQFPTVHALAEAPEEAVLKCWEGLGYYSRARNLQAGARQVMAAYGGELPHQVEELLKIKGIGAYTAGAIASIAYGEPAPAVDGNVLRVISRLQDIRENVAMPSAKRQIEQSVRALIPSERPGDFNQALMDLGARICTPGTPDCASCPLQGLCQGLASGAPEELPVLPQKKPPKVIQWQVHLLVQDGRILMGQRKEKLLQGLWVYPMTEADKSKETLAALKRATGLKVKKGVLLGEAKHVFTHQVWQMKIYSHHGVEGNSKEGWQWVTAEDMAQLALPTAIRKAKELAEALLQEETAQ